MGCRARNNPHRFGLGVGKHSYKRRTVRSYDTAKRKNYEYSIVSKENDGLKLCLKKKECKRKVKKLFEIYKENGTLFKRAIIKKLGKNDGYQFFNVSSLKNFVEETCYHSTVCEKAAAIVRQGHIAIEMNSQVGYRGLAGIFSAKCLGCKEAFTLQSSPKLECGNYDINVRAVWGTLVTGNGLSHLNELLAVLDTPGLNRGTFSSIELKINQWWEETLEEELNQAIEEEKKIAIENENYHDGVPSISVICDGGWSKRSHKHSYNAMGGVGVIIGEKTKKVLHIGVRNKLCYICTRARNIGCEAKPHKCFKNWEESSQAMEADIIVEGFKKADKHGVRYMNIIGDGDSSVYAKIQQEVPVWGREVTKKECANHVCKCLRSNLENLVEKNPSYKGKGNLTQRVRVRLVSAVRCAIRMRSNMGNKSEASKLLQKDIKNSIYHIFGIHDNCSSDFCKSKTSDQPEPVENKQCEDIQGSDVIGQQINFWTQGSSIEDQEEARDASSMKMTELTQKIIHDVLIILNRVSQKSGRLIGNYTSNLCESWMHVRSKFDGGKVYNHCNRFSWYTRCYAAALRTNFGPQWVPTIWEAKTKTKAGKTFTKHYAVKEKNISNENRYKAQPKSKIQRWSKKTASLRQSNTVKARQSYGPDALDVTSDIPDTELKKLQNQFLSENIVISENRIIEIEKNTRDQSKSFAWKQERKKRLTSSHFGQVIKRNPQIKFAPLIKSILYSNFKGNVYTRIGIENEQKTIDEYIERQTYVQTVEKVGLVISKENKYLAASPDGKVICKNGDIGLIEVKNVLYNRKLKLKEAAEMKVTNFCLKIGENDKLNLKQDHQYYFQCQGILSVTEYPWIDFVVRTENPYDLHIERIHRDPYFNRNWLPKLKAFYYHAMLPELAAPRHGKIPGIRENNKWFDEKPVKKKSTGTTKRKEPEQTRTETNPSCSLEPENKRSKRKIKTKFLGRTISHKMKVNGHPKWCVGTVLSLVKGVDGTNGVYEIHYEKDTESCQVHSLLDEYSVGNVKFVDC